ncbi:MAG: formylglycine-generating enzyme family protein [Candidatus Electronema sp. VV]
MVNVFCAVTNRNKPEDEGWGREKRPVINVSWEDAASYRQWLSQETGQPYRLPTVAEEWYTSTTMAIKWRRTNWHERGYCADRPNERGLYLIEIADRDRDVGFRLALSLPPAQR